MPRSKKRLAAVLAAKVEGLAVSIRTSGRRLINGHAANRICRHVVLSGRKMSFPGRAGRIRHAGEPAASSNHPAETAAGETFLAQK
jgi:hypothetical protein